MKIQRVFIIIFLLGLCLLPYSLHVGEIADNELQQLLELYYDDAITVDEYNDKYAECNDLYIRIQNLVNGLLTFSIFGFIFCAILRIRHVSDFKNTKTLNKPMMYFVINILWAIYFVGTWFYYGYRSWRGDYSPYQDAVMLAIVPQNIFNLIYFIPLNLFYFLFLRQTELPTTMGVELSTPKTKKLKILFSILYTFIVLNILNLINTIIGGDHFSIIITTLYIYTLFSLRAGIIKKHNELT